MKLSSFLKIIQKSVNEASGALNESSEEFIKEYFVEKIIDDKVILSPKVKTFEYKTLDEDNNPYTEKIEIPLITLIPHLSTPKIKEAKISCKFELDEKDNDIDIKFTKGKVFSKDTSYCALDLTIVPDKLPEGVDNMLNLLNNNL